METREVRSLQDLCDLFADYEVGVELRAGGTITLRFAPDEKWKAQRYNFFPLPVSRNEQGEPSRYEDRVRDTRNVIRELTSTEQFWRVTATAHHVGSFGMSAAGKALGIVKTMKRAGEPFTINFSSPGAARAFFEAIKKNSGRRYER